MKSKLEAWEEGRRVANKVFREALPMASLESLQKQAAHILRGIHDDSSRAYAIAYAIAAANKQLRIQLGRD